MPHSISSLYCEYYASCYPDEVKAIISLDGSSSAYNEAMPNVLKMVIPKKKWTTILSIKDLLLIII